MFSALLELWKICKIIFSTSEVGQVDILPPEIDFPSEIWSSWEDYRSTSCQNLVQLYV